jgi:hypothetical protein
VTGCCIAQQVGCRLPGITLRWLASPAVALVCFLASIVTLGQPAAAVGHGACRITQGAADKRRAWLALVLAAVAVISMPLTWQPIVLEVGKHGETGAIGEAYPVITIGAALAGALMLLDAAMTGHRAPAVAWGLVAGGSRWRRSW